MVWSTGVTVGGKMNALIIFTLTFLTILSTHLLLACLITLPHGWTYLAIVLMALLVGCISVWRRIASVERQA